jgi:hypothetical protein
MSVSRYWTLPRMALLGCGLLATLTTGCQSTVGGQTLPSAFYLSDDIQFFPAGPEFKLTKQVQAMEEYKLRQQGAEQQADADAPPP